MEDSLIAGIRKQVEESAAVYHGILEDDGLLKQIGTVASMILEAYRSGHKVLIAGNGGSAADAQHLACEVIGKFYLERPALPCIALTTNASVLTAVSNDFGYEEVFVRQVEAFGQPGDVFIAISTSGNSANILRAIEVCQKRKIRVVGFAGRSGGKMAESCEVCLKVPSDVTPRIQESHILMGHIIFSIVEASYFGKGL